ncbi:MAG: GNAT family N-acetyltransferase [Blastococcus sp.]
MGTEPHARGLGLARRLVAQAARHVLDQGRIPTYLHTFDNVASSRVAAAAGFPELGWSALMLSDEPAEAAA